MPINLDIQYATPPDIRSNITKYLTPKTQQVRVVDYKDPLENLPPYTLIQEHLSISYSSLKKPSMIEKTITDVKRKYLNSISTTINFGNQNTSIRFKGLFGEERWIIFTFSF